MKKVFSVDEKDLYDFDKRYSPKLSMYNKAAL